MRIPTVVVYGSGVLVQGVLSFLIVPLLTRLLDVSEFAAWALIDPLIILFPALALIGLQYGQLQALAAANLSRENAVRQLLRMTPVIALIATAGGAWGYLILPPSAPRWEIAISCAAIFMLEALIIGFQFQARGVGDARIFVAVTWVRSVAIVSVLLSLLLLSRQASLSQYLKIIIAADLSTLLFCVYLNRQNFHLPGDAADHIGVGLLVSYGFPLVLVGFLAQVSISADRYLVGLKLDSVQLGTYVANLKLAGAMTFAVAPVNLWWPRVRQQQFLAPSGDSFFSEIVPLALCYYFACAMIIAALAPQLAHLYAPNYVVDARITCILLLGWVCTGLATVVNIGTLEKGRTAFLAGAMLATVPVSVVITLYLVSLYGAIGAAVGTSVGQLINLLVIGCLSSHFHKVRHRWRLLVALTVLGASTLFMVAATRYIGLQISVIGGLCLCAFIFFRRSASNLALR